jgi:hypothetical protein
MGEVVAFGNATISTARSRFGGGSVLLDGSSYLNTSPERNFGNVDWCVDFWMRPAGVAARQMVVGAADSAADGAKAFQLLIEDAELRASIETPSLARLELSAPVVANRWQHVALTREGDTVRLFVNGELGDSADAIGPIPSSDVTLLVGAANLAYETSYFVGHIDEFRLVMGSAEYVEPFTPQTLPYYS